MSLGAECNRTACLGQMLQRSGSISVACVQPLRGQCKRVTNAGVIMHPKESRRLCRAGEAGRLCQVSSTTKLLVGQGGRTTIGMKCVLHVGWTTSGGVEELVEDG